MSKMGQNFADMQADAQELSQEEFAARWGLNNLDLYHSLRATLGDPNPEPEYVYPGSDPQT